MPEMPEIAEGQALLAALAEGANAWKSAAASREAQAEIADRLRSRDGDVPRLRLPRKRRPPFARVRELASGADNTAEQFGRPLGAIDPQCVSRGAGIGAEDGGNLRARNDERGVDDGSRRRPPHSRPDMPLSGRLDRRASASEEAARIYDPERDRDAKFRFGVDTGATRRSSSPTRDGSSARSDERRS